FVSPKLERFVARLRKTKIFQPEKVRLRSLNLSRSHCLARANGTEFFIQLRADRVLSAFTKRRKQAYRVRAVFVPHHCERCPIFIVRVRSDAHHRPRISQVKERLVQRDSICRGVSTARRVRTASDSDRIKCLPGSK